MSPDTLLEIHGYASPSGGEPYNLELSDKRAQSVYNYLYAVLGDTFGVPTHRTVVMGHGEWDAIYIGGVPNGTEIAEWRRVDVVINGALICSVFGEKGIE
jgi:outer membrane protein OmpA-like peptidoglycan-associated protein